MLIEDARRMLANEGYIAKVSAGGKVLVVYDGDVDSPGTWMECERIAIQSNEVATAVIEHLCT